MVGRLLRTALPALLAFGAVAGAVILAQTPAQAPSPLVLVSTAWPPFTNPSGQTRVALDLVETALGRFGMRANTTFVSAAQYTPALLEGKFDGSAAAWKDADRERMLIFSQPYLQNRLVLVGRRGADVSAAKLADLKGKRVAIVDGYSYGTASEMAGPTYVRAGSEEDSLTRLLKGTVDYTLMDDLVVQSIASTYPEDAAARLQIGSTPLLRRDLSFAVRRSRPDAEAIISKFNAQLRGMMADRTYNQVLHMDWIRADVNGDGVPELIAGSDHPGPAQPMKAYSLFAEPDQVKGPGNAPGFYVGGTLYSDWASVPDSYKTGASPVPDPRRASGTIFTYKW